VTVGVTLVHLGALQVAGGASFCVGWRRWYLSTRVASRTPGRNASKAGTQPGQQQPDTALLIE
jgi:hypothetical protein